LSVTKSDLLKQLNKTYPHLLKKDLSRFFDIFIEEIKIALQNNERVENSILSDTNNEISEVAEVTVHEEEIPTNSINKYKPQTASESNVRRLSLFDTLSDKQVDKAEDIEITPEKSEPILSSQEASENDPEKFVDNDISGDTKNEFNPEENELNNLDEEFNQENEEELLDIPTFLRRQAN